MRLRPDVTPNDHVYGPAHAPITLVEYGDFQCPYCGAAYYELKKVQKVLGDNIRFVFRNYPLVQIHTHAFHAAKLAEIAADYGKFWEMHDLLFENQRNLSDEHLMEYAEKVGIAPAIFVKAFSDPVYVDRIKEDLKSGSESGVKGTPSLFINGEKYEGDYRARVFIDYLRGLIES